MTSTKRDSFEELYSRLEQHVEKLEQGGLPLEEAIALYEQGMKLARACQERLEDAELKIAKLHESFALVAQRENGARLQDEGYVFDSDSGEPAADV